MTQNINRRISKETIKLVAEPLNQIIDQEIARRLEQGNSTRLARELLPIIAKDIKTIPDPILRVEYATARIDTVVQSYAVLLDRVNYWTKETEGYWPGEPFKFQQVLETVFSGSNYLSDDKKSLEALSTCGLIEPTGTEVRIVAILEEAKTKHVQKEGEPNNLPCKSRQHVVETYKVFRITPKGKETLENYQKVTNREIDERELYAALGETPEVLKPEEQK